MIPIVVAEAPADWAATPIAPPKIAENTGAALTSFRANRAPGAHSSAPGGLAAGTALVRGCVAVPIPGWVEEMRPAVEGRTTALAGAATEQITGAPMDARPDGGGQLDLRAANDLQGAVIGKARTFIGFDSSRVFSCFVACARERSAPLSPHALGCEAIVADARLEGSMAPPPPGLALRGLTWAIHHPHPTALTGGLFVLSVSFLAVLLRRRPRSA